MSLPYPVRALVTVTSGVATVALLASCTSDGDSRADRTGPATTGTTAGTTATTSPAATTGGSGAAGQTAKASSIVAAAQRAVPGGRVFDLERDDDTGTVTWDTKLATSGGGQVELTLRDDGSVAGRRQDATPDDDVAKLRSSSVGIERALTIAAARASGKGDVTSVEIDTDRGVTVWQVDFGGDNGTTVLVDAGKGTVVRVGRDAG